MIAGVIFEEDEDKFATTGKAASQLVYDDCTYMMADESFLENARQLKFDLAIVDSFILSPCNLILPKYLGIPFVTNMGFIIPWNIRIPALPSFANFMSPWKDLADITLTSRLSNLFAYVAVGAVLSRFAPDNNTLLERY